MSGTCWDHVHGLLVGYGEQRTLGVRLIALSNFIGLIRHVIGRLQGSAQELLSELLRRGPFGGVYIRVLLGLGL